MGRVVGLPADAGCAIPRRPRQAPARPTPSPRNPCDPDTTGARRAGRPRPSVAPGRRLVEVEPQPQLPGCGHGGDGGHGAPRGSGARYLRTTLRTHALQKMQNKGGAGRAARAEGIDWEAVRRLTSAATWSRLPAWLCPATAEAPSAGLRNISPDFGFLGLGFRLQAFG